jgi:hypothetical protein
MMAASACWVGGELRLSITHIAYRQATGGCPAVRLWLAGWGCGPWPSRPRASKVTAKEWLAWLPDGRRPRAGGLWMATLRVSRDLA